MRYRKLRNARSAAWSYAPVLLIVLWVPSYWWTHNLIANGFYYGNHTYSAGFSRTLLLIPLWCVTILATSFALAPLRQFIPRPFSLRRLLRFHFSVRTLLINTTLVAIGLGVYAARK